MLKNSINKILIGRRKSCEECKIECRMETIAIIHICSDSVRMNQFKLNKNNAYNLIEEYTESIYINENLDSNGNIQSDSISSLINILKNYKSICDSKKVNKIITIAGEALRSVSNCDIIVDLIQKRIQLEVQVITQEKQCYYDYLSVSAFMGHENAIIFDLSTTNLQIILMKNRKMEEYVSIPVGTKHLCDLLKEESVSSDVLLESVRNKVHEISSSIAWLSSERGLPVIGVGEILKQIATIDMVEDAYPIDILHGYLLSSQRLRSLYQKSVSASADQLKKWEGVSESTQSSFNVSLLFISELIEALGAKEMTLCSKGLRYGVFYEYLLENNRLIIRSPLMHSIENILKVMELDALHAFQIRWLAMEIFSNLRPYLDMDDIDDIDLNNIVNTSALLHDSGIIINYYNHHHHSFWVILNSSICGLSHKELLMSAYIASFHRKNNSYVDFEKYSYLLNERDIVIIEKLGMILKLSESLDKRMDNVVKNIDFTITDTEVIMDLSASTYPDMELRDAELLLSEFKRVIGRDLVLK